jgi:hypothetical protein
MAEWAKAFASCVVTDSEVGSSIPSAGRVSSKLITAAPVHQSSINLVLAEKLGSKS